MESILTSIKKMLGIAAEYEHFDDDIIMMINSVFADLTQMGVGPSEGFMIEDEDAIWDDFTNNNTLLNSVKTYMHLRVKLLFDPASVASATLASYERQISQWEWRLNLAAESMAAEESSGGSVQGVSDYKKLSNLPKINGTTLIDNYDEQDPSVAEMSEEDVNDLWNDLFDE